MKYGISQTKNQIFCANCGKALSTDGTIPYSFCPKCGCPLTPDAIDKAEKSEEQVKLQQLKHLAKIAAELETDSFKAILKEMEEE